MNLLVLSCKQWLIKCPFFRDELYFHPLSGLFISKFRLSAHVKLMINETKSTSTNEW